jgi:hypothetical protein
LVAWAPRRPSLRELPTVASGQRIPGRDVFLIGRDDVRVLLRASEGSKGVLHAASTFSMSHWLARLWWRISRRRRRITHKIERLLHK